MIKPEIGCRFFHFIPGGIILLLSLLVLNLSSNIIKERDSVSAEYIVYMNHFMELEESIHGLIDLCAEDLSNGKKWKDLRLEIESVFVKAVSDLDKIQRDGGSLFISGKIDNYVEYLRYLYEFNVNVAYIAFDIAESKKPDGNRRKNKDILEDINNRLQAMHIYLNRTHAMRVNSVANITLSGDIRNNETLLYWAIFAMGICGFVLVVMNSNKIKQLEDSHSKNEEAVLLLEERLAALEVATDGIFIMNSKGRLAYFNNAFYLIVSKNSHDITKENLLGKTWRDIFSRSDFEIIEEDILPDLYEEGGWAGSFEISSGRKYPLSVDMSLTKLPDEGIIGTLQDISYKKKAEQDKKQLEEQFYQAQKMEAIGRLAGGIAHDFNNILAAINGYAEFLMDDLDKESEQRSFAEKIYSAGFQAKELIDQILAFSRRGGTEKNKIDVVDAVNEVTKMLVASIPKNIEMNDKIGVRSAYIRGNHTQISQLVMNLCVNAQDAIGHENGSIKVILEEVEAEDIELPEVRESDLPDVSEIPNTIVEDIDAGRTRMIIGSLSTNHQYVKLRVCDSGEGMSRVIMEHIFEPFFTTKPVDKGTGLGLATVHGILVGHQGMMVVDSELSRGTCFDIYLPLLDNDVVVEDEQISEDDFGQGKEKKIDKHILLVEDQEVVAKMIIKMIERLGYNVSYASSGMEGLDMIRDNPETYDLVITDYNMPKMTGVEMATQVYLDIPDIKFILLSGYNEQKMREIIEEHPVFSAMLRKPVSKTKLSEVINRVINS